MLARSCGFSGRARAKARASAVDCRGGLASRTPEHAPDARVDGERVGVPAHRSRERSTGRGRSPVGGERAVGAQTDASPPTDGMGWACVPRHTSRDGASTAKAVVGGGWAWGPNLLFYVLGVLSIGVRALRHI